MKRPWGAALTFNILVLSAASLLNDVSSEMILPILPFFLVGIGGSAFFVGLVEGAADSVLSLVRVIAGHRSDATGRRKGFVSAGYGLSTLGKGLLALATGWPHVLLARVGDRVGKGVRDPARDALLADSTPAATRGTAFGFHRAMDTTGAVIGPLIALAFLLAAFTANQVFLLAAVPSVGAFLVTLAVRERRRIPSRRPLWGSLLALPAPLRRYLAVAALFSVGNVAMAFFLLRGCELLAEGAGACDVGAPAAMIALYVVFNVVYAGLSLVVGRLSDRHGRRPMVLAGYAVFAAAAGLFASAVGAGAAVIPLFLLLGAAFALVDGSQRALVVDLSPEGQRGLSLGAYHGITAGAKLASGLLAGGLYAVYGGPIMFLVAAALSGAAALAFLRALPPPTTPASPSS